MIRAAYFSRRPDLSAKLRVSTGCNETFVQCQTSLHSLCCHVLRFAGPRILRGGASLRDATRKGVEQLTRKSFSIRFSRALPILLILCDSCECPSRSDGPPVGWPCSERIACRGLRRSVDAGAYTYTPIYALCADAGTLLHPCINRQLHPIAAVFG